MIKKKMILADRDDMYLYNLSNYLMEKAPQLELVTFTREDKLIEYIQKGNGFDILAIDEGMLSPQVKGLAVNATRIVLSSSLAETEGFNTVKKYQKSETLLNEILLKYAEDTGGIEAIQGKSNTKILSFYSPAGGTGKTALALALSAAASSAGFKVLYLNLEEVDSVKELYPPTPGNLSDVFLALKTKGMNVEIKLSGSIGKLPQNGFYYISGVESVSEYEEINDKELGHLIEAIRMLSDYNMVIIDLSSSFSARNLQILEASDMIFTPVLSDQNSIGKLRRLLWEENYHEKYRSIFNKMKLVVNRSVSNSLTSEFQSSGLANRFECCALIGNLPVLTKYEKIIRNEEIVKQLMNPLLQAVASL